MASGCTVVWTAKWMSRKMARRHPRVLFISHSATRNGATILLLGLIRWLKQQVDWDMEVLMNGHGPLVPEFRSLCRVNVWRNPAKLLPRLLSADLEARLLPRLESQYVRALLAWRGFDLVYANTAACWPQVAALNGCAPALLWHIHELGYGLRRVIGSERSSRLFPRAKRFIAVSQSAAETLVGEFGVPRDKVDVVHGFAPMKPPTDEGGAALRRRVRDRLGLPAKAFVVGGCGSLGWRKGTDLFLQIASVVCRNDTADEIRFVWVGGNDTEPEALEFAHDVNALGLNGKCLRMESTSEVSEIYCAMDLFALSSREDPFPLVMLEAGLHGLPVVCFEGAGGAPEFVGNDAGCTIPYLDVESFAAQLKALRGQPDVRRQMGAVASRRARVEFCIDSQGPKLLSSISRCLRTQGFKS